MRIADFRKILGSTPEDHSGLDAAEGAFFGELPAARRLRGFELDSATQGKDGLEKVRQSLVEGRPYAMAFIDVRMPPGWDGIETTARIWEIYPDLQVVICTAYSDYSWDDMLARLGESDRLVILKKPFDNIEVLQLTNALTEKWRLLQISRIKIAELESAVHDQTRHWQKCEARQRTLCDFSPFGIVEIDHQGNCLYSNPRWTILSGRGAEENLGTGWAVAIHPEDRDALATLWQRTAREKGELSRESRVQNAAGEIRWINFVIAPITSATGQASGFLAFAEDITGKKRLETQLRQAQKLAAIGQRVEIPHAFEPSRERVGGISNQSLRFTK
jgi:two-component system cell cycle sensor histidine kinase/response regulator CckA